MYTYSAMNIILQTSRKAHLKNYFGMVKCKFKKDFKTYLGVNFINVKRTNFLYKCHFGTFYYIHVTRKKLPKWRSYKKITRLTLMKLTTGLLYLHCVSGNWTSFTWLWWFGLRLKPFFNRVQGAWKNDTCIKSYQKWLWNNHLVLFCLNLWHVLMYHIFWQCWPNAGV